jgi:tetratricopeptide (TPR) repeat protein
MKSHFLAVILLCCFCVSCASLHKGIGDSSPPPVSKKEKVLQKKDSGCAYSFFLQGKSAEMKGEIEDALNFFEKAVVCDENADYIKMHLAMLLSKTGRIQHAQRLMEEVVERDPEDIEAQAILAGLYAHTEDLDKAIGIYKSVLIKQPDNYNVMLMLGTLYARNRELGRAREVFEDLVKKDPQSYVGYYYLARLYRELRYFDKAAAAYKEALSLNQSVVLFFELAELYEQQNQLKKAIDVYQQVLAGEETNEQARRKLAKLYLDAGDVDQSIKELQKLRLYVDDKRKVDLIIGRVMLQQKRFKDAVAFFTERLEKDPQFYTARYLLAVAYHETGDNTKAEKLLREIPSLSKEYEDAIFFMAGIYREDKNYLKLEKLLKENIIDEKSRKVTFYVALAALYEEQKDVDKAKKIYDDAFKVYPADTKLLFEYGLFLDGIGEMKNALASMEKVLELNPDDPYALNYVGYTWADNNVNLEKALNYIERAIVQRPEDGFIRDSLGWVYFKLGNFDKAIAEIENAISLKADDPAIHEHLGDAYLKKNKVKKAQEEYEKALQLFGDDKKKEGVVKKIEKLKK